jgi:hypothetical protein
MTTEGRPLLSQDTYKNYSLDQLKVWVLDSLQCEATPKEIADCIMGSLKEEKTYYLEQIAFIDLVEQNLKGSKISNVTKKDWDDFWEAL